MKSKSLVIYFIILETLCRFKPRRECLPKTYAVDDVLVFHGPTS